MNDVAGGKNASVHDVVNVTTSFQSEGKCAVGGEGSGCIGRTGSRREKYVLTVLPVQSFFTVRSGKIFSRRKRKWMHR